jgi:hypothetical protein
LTGFLPATGRQEIVRLGQIFNDNIFYQPTFLTECSSNTFASGRLAFDKLFSADSFFAIDIATKSFTASTFFFARRRFDGG